MSGFTDLRLNRQDGQTQESFWPSFTDIMTVIVMIFLIAMVVLLLRNMELVNQLRATMEAERVAAELVLATGQEKDSLSISLHQAEEQIEMMQLEIMRLHDRSAKQDNKISQQQTRMQNLSKERDEQLALVLKLKRLRDKLETDISQKLAQLSSAQSNITGLNSNIADLKGQYNLSQEQLAVLQSQYNQSQNNIDELQAAIAQQTQTMEALRQQNAGIESKYLVLASDYDTLTVKYNKLIKPARSAKARHLVEVRYWKDGEEYKITWREGKSSPYKAITRKQLDNVLGRLDKQQKNGLYIKVIFPDKSGLSYAEAWSFTSHLHKNYDYYFKDNPRK